MSKSKRLIALMMTINQKRKFTVKELAQEFDVSTRTILRDLQELSELGVPLYSEVGPHGGYRVLNNRILPPIAFSEQEAIAVFFASHALRHFSSLPFKAELSTVLKKFYFYMSDDIRQQIDQMKNRIDFVSPTRWAKAPFLSNVLQAAIEQQVIQIDYESRSSRAKREIQPIGIYANQGYWYCPAYSFDHKDFRLFRCDRIHGVSTVNIQSKPLDFEQIHLGNKRKLLKQEKNSQPLYVELSQEGVQKCEAEFWLKPHLQINPDGTGCLEMQIAKKDLSFFAKFFIGLGDHATVKQPAELIEGIKNQLTILLDKYSS